MRPVDDVQKETAAVLADAVTELTMRAIEPSLKPFKDELRPLVRTLDEHVEAIEGLIRDQLEALSGLDERVRSAAEIAVRAESTFIRTLERVKELEAGVGRVADDLGNLRTQQSTARELAVVTRLVVANVALAALALGLSAAALWFAVAH